jgi:hypothetical protein
MLQLETTLSRADARDCAHWIMSAVGTRVASKHQKTPFVAEHMARQTVPRYLRGSDRSERLYVSFQVLLGAGYAYKEALVVVAVGAKEFLGESKRGRPKRGDAKRDLISTMASVRSMVNAFADVARNSVES